MASNILPQVRALFGVSDDEDAPTTPVRVASTLTKDEAIKQLAKKGIKVVPKAEPWDEQASKARIERGRQATEQARTSQGGTLKRIAAQVAGVNPQAAAGIALADKAIDVLSSTGSGMAGAAVRGLQGASPVAGAVEGVKEGLAGRPFSFIQALQEKNLYRPGDEAQQLAAGTALDVLVDPANVVPGKAVLRAAAMLPVVGKFAKVAKVADDAVDVARTAVNASGESAASLEAIGRMRAMAGKGEQFAVRQGGKVTPLIGPEAADFRPRRGQEYGILSGDGEFKVLQRGSELGAVNPALAVNLAGGAVGAAGGAALAGEEQPLLGAAVGAAAGMGATQAARMLAQKVGAKVSDVVGGLADEAARPLAAAAEHATIEEAELRSRLIQRVPGRSRALGLDKPATPSRTTYNEGTVKRVEEEARMDRFLKEDVGFDAPEDVHAVRDILEDGGRYYKHRRMVVEDDGTVRARSWSQAEEEAKNIIWKNIKLPKGTTLNDAEMMSLKNKAQGVVEYAKDIDNDLKAVESALANGRVDEANALLIKYGVGSQRALEILADQAAQEVMVVTRSLVGARSEAGRSLNALKKAVKWRKVAASDDEFLMRASELGMEGPEVRRELRNLETPEQRYIYLRNRAKATEADIFRWYYVSSLLSAPLTHAKNILSNKLNLLSMETALAASGATDVLRGRKVFTDYRDELKQARHGAAVGAITGWKEAVKVFQRGFTIDDAMVLAEKPPEIKFSDLGRPDWNSERSTKWLNSVGRFLEASDTFSRTVSFSSAIHMLAYRRASQLVREGKLRPSQFNKHAEEIVRDPAVVAPDLFEQAKEFAADAIYRQPAGEGLASLVRLQQSVNKWGDKYITRNLDKITNKPVRVAAKIATAPLANLGTLTVPFIRTPFNVFTKQLRGLGGGFFTGRELAKEGKDLMAAVHRGEAMLGVSTLAALSAWALSADRPIITGVGPSEPELKEALDKGLDAFYASHVPNSIRIPFTDQWIDYRSFGPMAGVLAAAGNISDSARMHKGSPFSTITDAAFRQVRSFLSNSFLTGIMGIMSAWEDRSGATFNRIIGRTSSGLLPASSLMRMARQGTDPVLRDTKADTFSGVVWNNVRNTLPGLSQSVRPRIGYAGETLRAGGTAPSRMLNPLRMTHRKEDTVRRELAKLGKDAYLSKPDDSLTDMLGHPMDLTPLQQAELQSRVGQAQYRAAQSLLATQAFRDAPATLRARILKKFMTKAREQAKMQYRLSLHSASTAKP